MQRRGRRIVPHLFGQEWVNVAEPAYRYTIGGISQVISAAVGATGTIAGFGSNIHGKRFRDWQAVTGSNPHNPKRRKSFRVAQNQAAINHFAASPPPELPPPPGATPEQRSSGMSRKQNEDEVMVMPEGNPAISHPDYFNIVLPYHGIIRHSIIPPGGSPPGDSTPQFYEWRLNSIYDPDKTNTDAFKQPLGRDTWASVYDYYRVLQTDVLITVQNMYQLASSGRGCSIFGYQLTDGTSKAETRDAFMEGKHNKGIMLGPHGSGTDHAVFQFSYRPENWDHHITNQDSSTRWTPVGSNPAISHILATSCFPAFPTEGSELIYQIQLKYHVQFRETNASIKHTTD
jgi:hypothetical protein